MFRKLIAACVLTMFSGVCWTGQYDGIWQIPGHNGSYQIIRHQDDGLFVLVVLGSDDGHLYDDWIATLIGSISANTAANIRAADALNATNLEATITFNSPFAATLVVSQCTPKPNKPADSCPPVNELTQLIKIF